ncbi:MAG: hypothetical protein JXB33_00710 [Clostridia bacterium]|nr:hypothetical protein [Clostridia bacterium]
MREIDRAAVEAAGDFEKISEMIKEYEFFILRKTAAACGRFITKSDDEWAVSLNAFSKAVEKYDYDKGSFLSFAELMIRRSLIDHFRAESRRGIEISTDPAELRKNASGEAEWVRLEISEITGVLKAYGISFMDLADCSPKAGKTKKSCAEAVRYLLMNPGMIDEMGATGLLPLKIIEENTGVPRKIMERHRKYIIAAAEILNGDYPNIAEYLSYIRKEADE